MSSGFATRWVLLCAIGVGTQPAVPDVARMPEPPPEGLVRVSVAWTRGAHGAFSVPEFLDVATESRRLERLAAYVEGDANLGGDGEALRVSVGYVTPDFFPVLGVPTIAGRWFTDEEGERGHDQVVILGHDLWRRRFAADPGVLGRSVVLDHHPYTVVGILPPGFTFDGEFDLYAPFPFPAEMRTERQRLGRFVRAIGRMAPGTTLAELAAELDAIGARVMAAHCDVYPPGAGWRPQAEPLEFDGAAAAAERGERWRLRETGS